MAIQKSLYHPAFTNPNGFSKYVRLLNKSTSEYLPIPALSLDRPFNPNGSNKIFPDPDFNFLTFDRSATLNGLNLFYSAYFL